MSEDVLFLCLLVAVAIIYRASRIGPANTHCRWCGLPVANVGEDLCVRCDAAANEGRN